MIKNTICLCFLFFLFLFLVACNNREWYSKVYKFEIPSWTYSDTVTYTFSVEDTATLNELVLDVEYDQMAFGFQNLYVNIQTIFPNLQSSDQVVSLEILGAEAQVFRKCSKDICTVPILLMNDFRFTNVGQHTLKISQYSRQDSLQGVRSLRLKIAKN